MDQNHFETTSDDDEWYCESIYRYDELIMFELEHKVVSVDLMNSTCACLLCEKSPGNQLVLYHSLPLKLYKNLDRKVKDTDMKIKSGLFPESFVLQMCCLYTEDKMITSEKDVRGIKIYQISSETEMQKAKLISAPVLEPRVSIVDKNSVILAKDTLEKPCLLDIMGEKIKNDFIIDGTPGPLIPLALSQNEVAFSNIINGEINFYDIRSNRGWKIQAKNQLDVTACSNFDYRNSTPGQFIGTLDKNGNYIFYDIRSKKPLISGRLNFCDNKDLKMKFSPNSRRVSISGNDSDVSIYNFENFNEVFRHDGHKRMEHCSKTTTVTDHLWYDDKTVISSADNHSLNCWQYVYR